MLTGRAGGRQRAAERLSLEKAALQALSGHPGVITLLGTAQDQTALVLIFDFLPKGRLTALAPLPRSVARYYVAAIAAALSACHEAGWLHRDLKLDNVLLDGSARPRLADFGLCCKLPAAESAEGRPTTLVGTLCCCAPEMLSGEGYGPGADWWALGVAGWHLLAGAPPWDPSAEPSGPFTADSPAVQYWDALVRRGCA